MHLLNTLVTILTSLYHKSGIQETNLIAWILFLFAFGLDNFKLVYILHAYPCRSHKRPGD